MGRTRPSGDSEQEGATGPGRGERRRSRCPASPPDVLRPMGASHWAAEETEGAGDARSASLPTRRSRARDDSDHGFVKSVTVRVTEWSSSAPRH